MDYWRDEWYSAIPTSTSNSFPALLKAYNPKLSNHKPSPKTTQITQPNSPTATITAISPIAASKQDKPKPLNHDPNQLTTNDQLSQTKAHKPVNNK
jgi:hypothetical protein